MTGLPTPNPDTITAPVARDRKLRATEFEESIKVFLERLAFANVDGAKDSFRIGGNQVDVCGGHENTLLVIECFRSQAADKEAILRSKIREFRGSQQALERGFRSHSVYGKYKRFQYILAVKNVRVRREDLDLANERPRIYIWDDNFREYYEDLFQKIGVYAKYNLFY